MPRQEERVKQHWKVRRQTVPRSDGARRWDQAYQHLLRRTTPPQVVLQSEEVQDASSALCPGLDHSAGAGPDD
jgi:hypothetical protein